jgi:hypothetical protein
MAAVYTRARRAEKGFWQRRAPRRRVSGMAQRSGSADLPLHGGRVPRWLTER